MTWGTYLGELHFSCSSHLNINAAQIHLVLPKKTKNIQRDEQPTAVVAVISSTMMFVTTTTKAEERRPSQIL